MEQIELYTEIGFEAIRNSIYGVVVALTTAITVVIDYIVEFLMNIIPDVSKLPDIEQYLKNLVLTIPNLADIIPTDLLGLNIVDLLKSFTCA